MVKEEQSTTVRVRGLTLTIYPWQRDNGTTAWRFTWYDKEGKRRYSTRADKKKAIQAAKEKAREIHNGTLDFGSITESEARLCQAFLDLKPDWKTIERLRADMARERVTAEVAFDRFIASKESNAGASTRNVSTLKNRLGHFKKEFGERDLDSISVSDLDQWLAAGKWEASTKKRIRASVVTFFRWARKQEILPDQTTVAEKMAVPLVHRKAPTTYTPEEFSTLISKVRPKYRAWLLICGWAGVRLEELCLGDRSKKDVLRWEDIDLENGIILIRPEVSKTNERRVIPICEALASELTQIHGKTGQVLRGNPTRSRKSEIAETKRLGKLIGGWRPNALRHSFVSYRCALVGVGKAAMEAGNSEHETRRSYLNAKTEKEARDWFQLRNICGT